MTPPPDQNVSTLVSFEDLVVQTNLRGVPGNRLLAGFHVGLAS